MKVKKKPGKIRTGILGGSGYGGGELLRLLHGHPRVETAWCTSRKLEGRPIGEAHPSLRHLDGLSFTAFPSPVQIKEVDAIFCALPHGKSMEELPRILDVRDEVQVLDLGGDFRLKDPKSYEAFYGHPHHAAGLLPSFVYGSPETNRSALRGARRIACPGCFATGAILALYPMARAGWLPPRTVIDSKTGSTGSGAEPSKTTHHPERAENLRAYKIFSHQHEPEILQALPQPTELAFVPHSVPMARGIFTTAHLELPEGASEEAVRKCYRRFAQENPFVRFLEEGSPECRSVRGSNFADLAVHARGRNLAVLCAIDNLVKGAAGQAVQCLNISQGWEETEGLNAPALCP
jgi:N-acetyl-gamma-glutamyl-phosphate reductase common form